MCGSVSYRAVIRTWIWILFDDPPGYDVCVIFMKDIYERELERGDESWDLRVTTTTKESHHLRRDLDGWRRGLYIEEGESVCSPNDLCTPLNGNKVRQHVRKEALNGGAMTGTTRPTPF